MAGALAAIAILRGAPKTWATLGLIFCPPSRELSRDFRDTPLVHRRLRRSLSREESGRGRR